MDLPQWLTVAGWLVSPTMAAAVGALVATRRAASDRRAERDERDRLQADALKALLWAKLDEMHRRYVVEGAPCDTAQKQTAQGIYSAYHALGGNGVGTHYFEEIVEAHRATGSIPAQRDAGRG